MDDTIYRQAAIEHLKKRLYETALNNVTEHPYYEEMADNRVSVWLKEVPSAQPEIPEIIRCKDCKYAEVADKEDRQDGYTCQFHRGSIWFSGSYCSWAERRQDADSSGNMSGTHKNSNSTETHSCDCISRQAVIDRINKQREHLEPDVYPQDKIGDAAYRICAEFIERLPSAQLGQRYTNEELMIFQQGISLSLLSKRSAQHWRYDENRATEIKFLERLYEKVGADMRGGQDDR